MQGLLTEKTAVVTGGASGIGRAIAKAFADHGADVVVADRQQQPRLDGRPTHVEIEARTDAEARFVACDVTDRADLERVVDVASEMGGLDVMVNNAGVLQLYDYLEGDDTPYETVMDVNVKGVYLGSQVAARRMLESGGGSIVNLASIRADVGHGGYVSYCASKGAVKTMTYALADRLGPEIRVNAIKPGTIETAQTRRDAGSVGGDDDADRLENVPLGRFGRPEDVANAAVFFASSLSSYVSGESLLVDGGLTNTKST